MKITVCLVLLLAKKQVAAHTHKVDYQVKNDSVKCITRIKLVEYSTRDTLFQLVEKPAISNLISAIKAREYGYRYDKGI